MRRAGTSGGDGWPQSFTGQKSNDQFDVIRFTIRAVVDQRQVLGFIDALGKVNFYRCINLSYEGVPPSHAEQGYLYGAAPYVLTLILLVWSSSPRQALVGAPGELTITR